MTHPDGVSGTPDAPAVGPALSFPAGNEPVPADVAAPAPAQGAVSPRSPLGSLRAQREKRLAKLFLDIKVPGWGDDPELEPRVFIYVRCRPLKPSELAEIGDTQSKREKKGRGGKDWIDRANADMLATACQEVWLYSGPEEPNPAEVPEDERLSLNQDSPNGPKTRFDGDAADALGMTRGWDNKPPAAVDVVRNLFDHDGDIMQAVEKLVTWSNLRAGQEQTDFTNG